MPPDLSRRPKRFSSPLRGSNSFYGSGTAPPPVQKASHGPAVTKIIPGVPPVYRLQDYAEDEIEGVFYAEELQKVHKLDDIYKI